MLPEQVGVKGHMLSGGATALLAFHGADMGDLGPHAHLVRPCLDLRPEKCHAPAGASGLSSLGGAALMAPGAQAVSRCISRVGRKSFLKKGGAESAHGLQFRMVAAPALRAVSD